MKTDLMTRKSDYMNEHQLKKIREYTMHCGRKVMRVPVDSHDYINVGDLSSRQWVSRRQWWLVIEENGFTWLWDGMIMEG